MNITLKLCGLALGACVAAQAVTVPTASLSLVSGQPQLSIRSDPGITNQILCKTNLSQTNWVVLTNVLVSQSPYWFVDTAVPPATLRFYQVTALVAATPPPSGMALIPAGTFTMGNSVTNDTDIPDATPKNIYVSAFYMDTNLVSYGEWQAVYAYATNQGYGFGDAGGGKAANHPVQTVDWWDCVKWCNARSQQAGLTPVYYTDAGLTLVHTNGDTDAVYPNWAANGYRLPTEAEWEKAARGGVSGQRFPWGDTTSWDQANYYGDPLLLDPIGYAYDLATAIDYDPVFNDGVYPFTSPVGSFVPNGYGLNDMAGNVWQWCWDWYGTPYGQPETTNPTGPGTGSYRVFRGGSWTWDAAAARCANRAKTAPDTVSYDIGFRCVRGS